MTTTEYVGPAVGLHGAFQLAKSGDRRHLDAYDRRQWVVGWAALRGWDVHEICGHIVCECDVPGRDPQVVYLSIEDGELTFEQTD